MAVSRYCEGKVYQLPVATIARANLVPDWDAEFRRQGASRGGEGGTKPSEPERKGEWEHSHDQSKTRRDETAAPHAPHRSAS